MRLLKALQELTAHIQSSHTTSRIKALTLPSLSCLAPLSFPEIPDLEAVNLLKLHHPTQWSRNVYLNGHDKKLL